MNTKIYLISILLLVFSLSKAVKSQAVIDLETGIIFTGYNNVRIPGNQGTLFSLKDDLQSNPKIFYRLRGSYIFKSRHTISALYAPLQTKAKGNVANDILYQGVLFPANVDINASYKFNSYRLTYRYKMVDKPKIEFGLGFTAKIRDANISLSAPGLKAEKANVGFVPIINFRFLWKINGKFRLLLDGDALAAPQGRAEDVLIAAAYKLSDKLNIRAGYRILEGGADNDEVYNFTLFHYASLGFSYSFEN
jgi:hypothetical protein